MAACTTDLPEKFREGERVAAGSKGTGAAEPERSGSTEQAVDDAEAESTQVGETSDALDANSQDGEQGEPQASGDAGAPPSDESVSNPATGDAGTLVEQTQDAAMSSAIEGPADAARAQPEPSEHNVEEFDTQPDQSPDLLVDAGVADDDPDSVADTPDAGELAGPMAELDEAPRSKPPHLRNHANPQARCRAALRKMLARTTRTRVSLESAAAARASWTGIWMEPPIVWMSALPIRRGKCPVAAAAGLSRASAINSLRV